MKKFLLLACLSIFVTGANAGTMTFEVSGNNGMKVSMLLNTTSASTPVTVDWGNGEKISYTVDPSLPADLRWIEGSLAGKYITIDGDVTEAKLNGMNLTTAKLTNMSSLTSLDLSNNQLTDFRTSGKMPLKTLLLYDNKLVNYVSDNRTLTLENCGSTLEILDVSFNNGLQCLDLRYLTALRSLFANDCPKLYSVFICQAQESRPTIQYINLNNCELTHFNPVGLPNLETLLLANNKLISYDDDPFVLGNYASLKTLDVSNNTSIKDLDLSVCRGLEVLNVADNKLSLLDLAHTASLRELNAANNNISVFDFAKSTELNTLNISGNPVNAIDLTKFDMLRSVDISKTEISRIDLTKAYNLAIFRASDTNLEFVDFNGQYPDNITEIDLRNNALMTGASVSYTIYTLPAGKSNGAQKATLLLAGSNAGTADIYEAQKRNYNCDINGDASAQWKEVQITLSGATDTGLNITGHVDRVYPTVEGGMDYDFDVYETDGGKFVISQWQPTLFHSMLSVTNTALTGVPIHVKAYPADGKQFDGITVNGNKIKSEWFIVDGPATVSVDFTDRESSLSFVTVPGQSLSMLVNTTKPNGTVWVDWGTGTNIEYKGQKGYTRGQIELGGTRIDGTASAEKITVTGDIAAIDLSGWGDVAGWLGLWDNKIQSVDLSNIPGLQYLNLHWNPVEALDLTGADNLEVLDIGYCNMTQVSLAGAPKIYYLDASSDGIGGDGIALLTDIDVSTQSNLQYLNIKGNRIASLDLSHNPKLWQLYAQNNRLTELDLSKNPIMEILELSGNSIASLDVTMLPELTNLTLSKNQLNELDLSKNPRLAILYVDNNRLSTLDLSANTELRKIYLNGNGMTAEQLNDTYYKLPQRRPNTKEEDESETLSYNLAVIQGNDNAVNNGTGADSSIAVDRGWSPSHSGTNTGATTAYLDILPSEHGTATVVDAAGYEYVHGSKVPKNSLLTIKATPQTGYKLKSYALNGGFAEGGNEFKMPTTYTKLTVNFGVDAGVDNVTNDSVEINSANGCISISAEHASVSVWNVAGVSIVADAQVDGDAFIAVNPGVYIVRAVNQQGSITRKIIVK